MSEYTTRDMIDFAINKQPSQVAAAFDSLIRDRLAPEIEQIADQVGFGSDDQNDDDDDFDADDSDSTYFDTDDEGLDYGDDNEDV